MRFMVLIKADKEPEAGVPLDEKLLAAMGKFNDELEKAGVLLAVDGLQPTAKGARIKFRPGAKPVVADGPFTESKELIGGFWVIQASSKEEAIEWFKRCPAGSGELEIRQVWDAADLTDVVSAETCAIMEAGEQLFSVQKRA